MIPETGKPQWLAAAIAAKLGEGFKSPFAAFLL
jgi:hypothetical protein